MSIQTSVYIEGYWTTVNVDINQIIAQNRAALLQQETADPEYDKEPEYDREQAPLLLGILTQTVIRSPVIKSILPAQIRNQAKNDVVFVYGNYIEIKEIPEDEYGHMRTVAEKADFGSAIRCVRVLGLPSSCHVSGDSTERDDVVVKEETQELYDYSLDPPLQIPPQMLVMTLETNKLVFLFAIHDDQNMIQFVTAQRPLPASPLIHKQLGEHIAVDPKSRAMAVAAFDGKIIIYALKTMDEMKNGVDGGSRGDNLQPVKEELHLEVEGLILKMEFLHPPESVQHSDQVILLLVVNHNSESRLVCYEWDCSSRLDTYNMVGNSTLKTPGQKLHEDDELPLLLVPLKKSAAFLLISEKRMTVYKNILTGWAHAFTIPSDKENPEEPGCSKLSPLWIQWARPLTTGAQNKDQDKIYLCREDGTVHLLNLDETFEPIFQTIYPVGKLGINVNESFALANLRFVKDEDQVIGAEILLAGGEMSDGGRWSVGAGKECDIMEPLRNWTPLMDIATSDRAKALTEASESTEHPARSVQARGRFFASTGRGSKHGNITEIRYGVEATRKGTLDLDSRITQLWVLGHIDGSNLVLLSYPTQTSLLRIHQDAETIDSVDSTYYHLDYDTMTIAVGMTMKGLIVQVTRNSVLVTMAKAEARSFYQQANILVAHVGSIRGNDSKLALFMAVQEEDSIRLHLGCLDTSGYIPIGPATTADSDPVSLHLAYIGDEYCAFVGTVGSRLQVWRVDPQRGLTASFLYQFDCDFSICASIAVLTTQVDTGTENLVVCGLRNGAVDLLTWDFSWPKKPLQFRERLQIGNTTVTVSRDKIKDSRAIIHCEQKLYSMEYPLDSSAASVNFPMKCQLPASVNSIWITDPSPAFQQGDISTFAQGASGVAKGLIFSVGGSQIHMAEFLSELEPPNPRMIPRRIPVPGTPVKLIYSDRLKKLAVIYYTIDIIRGDGNRNTAAKQRSLKYHLAVIDPNATELDRDASISSAESPIYSKSGERFLGLIEWFPKIGTNIHHFFLVHTILSRRDPADSRGRILIFAVSDHIGRNVLTFKRHWDKEAPVYALAPYGENSILYTCGKYLCLQSLETSSSAAGSTAKLSTPITYDLMTRGLYISVDIDEFIYVTTDGNGINIFALQDEGLVRHCISEKAREGIHHIVVPQRDLVITSQRDRTVTGLWQHAYCFLPYSTEAIFEATLPSSITRFAPIRRPLWQQGPGPEDRDFPPPHDALTERSAFHTDEDPIIGTSTNGAIYQFQILEADSWRLLRFLQNLVMRHTDIFPFGDSSLLPDPEAYTPTSRRIVDAEEYHVDGDILRLWLERGEPERILYDILHEDVAPIPGYRRPSEAKQKEKGRPNGGQRQVYKDKDDEFGHDVLSWSNLFANLACEVGIIDNERGPGVIPPRDVLTDERVERWQIERVIRWVRLQLQVAL